MYTAYRIHHRGGSAPGDDLMGFITATNCLQLCTSGMNWNSLGPVVDGRHPVYFKCFDAISPVPLNHRRVQHLSQLNTVNLDPTLPQMNVTDWRACMRILLLTILYYYRALIKFIIHLILWLPFIQFNSIQFWNLNDLIFVCCL